MSEKLRLRATMTVEVEYEVDIADTDDPQKIVDMEQMSFDQDPADLLGRDEAQHWVDVEDITYATTDQIDEVPIPPWSPDFNVTETQTGRITRTIETPPDEPDEPDEPDKSDEPNKPNKPNKPDKSDESEPPRRTGGLEPGEEVTFGGSIQQTGIKRGPYQGMQPVK